MISVRITLLVLPIVVRCLFLSYSLLATEKGSPHLVVDKQALTITYFDAAGQAVATYGVACGDHYGNKEVKGDRKTPEGVFRINQILNSRGIPHDFGDGKGPVPNAYGPWFFRLDVPGFHDIGIHGTHLPESIGSRATEGCVRMRNEDILALRPYVYLGMSVTVLPDKKPTENVDEPVIPDDAEEEIVASSVNPHASYASWILLCAFVCLIVVSGIFLIMINKGE